MPDKFKAVVINNQNEKFTREIKEISKDELKDGNVLVKIDYSSLNYKDALILNNGGKIVRKFPFVPGIDFAGKVVESEDAKFKKDDNVILTGFRVGEAYFGLWSLDLKEALYKDITNGHRKVEEWADKIGPEIIEINDEKDYNFLNINTKEDLEEAKNKIK